MRSALGFDIRFGGERIESLGQMRVKHGASRLALHSTLPNLLVSSASSKPDNLSLIDTGVHSKIWTRSVLGASAHVFALPAVGFLVASGVGKIGSGHSELEFINGMGDRLKTVAVPDRLSQVRIAGDAVVAGCRDGNLYVFDRLGTELWRYEVPEPPTSGPDDSAARPCPYFIESSADGQFIAFSFLETVYMFNKRGRLLWSWRARVKHKRWVSTSASGHRFEEGMSGVEPIIYGLAVANCGSSVIAASDGSITALSAQGEANLRVSAAESPCQFAATADHSRMIYSHWDGIDFYVDGERLAQFPTSGALYRLRIAPDERYVAAWGGRTLLLFEINGQPEILLEFLKNITDIVFVSPIEFAVAAGKAEHLRFESGAA